MVIVMRVWKETRTTSFNDSSNAWRRLPLKRNCGPAR